MAICTKGYAVPLPEGHILPYYMSFKCSKHVCLLTIFLRIVIMQIIQALSSDTFHNRIFPNDIIASSDSAIKPESLLH